MTCWIFCNINNYWRSQRVMISLILGIGSLVWHTLDSQWVTSAPNIHQPGTSCDLETQRASAQRDRPWDLKSYGQAICGGFEVLQWLFIYHDDSWRCINWGGDTDMSWSAQEDWKQTNVWCNLWSHHKWPKLLSPTKRRQKVVYDGDYMQRFLFGSSWLDNNSPKRGPKLNGYKTKRCLKVGLQKWQPESSLCLVWLKWPQRPQFTPQSFIQTVSILQWQTASTTGPRWWKFLRRRDFVWLPPLFGRWNPLVLCWRS